MPVISAGLDLLRPPYRWLRLQSARARMRLAPLLGKRGLYGLPAGYRQRKEPAYFDDVENTDEWQREVYEAARAIMVEHRLRTVHDVGCGSGYKLVHILGQFETTGIDLPQTIERVRRRYPDRRWLGASFDEVNIAKADLVICADVIEHVERPDVLMDFLVRVATDRVVLSTPDRNVFYDQDSIAWYGPPSNPAHMREWTVEEFHEFVGRYLDVERHEFSNAEQGTQMIVGRVRR